MTIALVTVEFLCGSFMFSYWLGLLANKDLNTVGDGNPGAFNLWHAAGYKLGLLGVFLDVMKGYLPLVFFIELGTIKGMAVVFVAIAPIMGHAFSPFTRFRGGKAIAVTFGVWSAVSRFEISIAYAVILAVLKLAEKGLKKGKPIETEMDAVMVVIGMLVLGVYIVARAFPGNLIALWFGNLIILTYTNRTKLQTFFKNIYDKYEQKNRKIGV